MKQTLGAIIILAPFITASIWLVWAENAWVQVGWLWSIAVCLVLGSLIWSTDKN